jgi:hypothetical protein
LYLNAVPVAGAPVTGPLDSSKAPLEIGSYAGQAIWSGTIDEVAVYDRAIPAATIASRYRLGIDLHPPGPSAYRDAVLATKGLVSYWRLDNLGAVATDSRGHNNGVFTPGVDKGAPGLISGEPDKSVVLNGNFGSVKVPPSQSLALRRAFTLEAWVTTISVANRHIVSRLGSWFLKTDALGRWAAGVYVKGAITTVFSKIVAHGPQSPRPARPRPVNHGSSFNPLWILIPIAVIAVGIALWRREAPSPRAPRQSDQ